MRRVAIVGAGIVGTTLAYHLVKAGHQVDLFENGGETPYPHTPQFEANVLYANHFAPPTPVFPTELPEDIKGLVQSGDYEQSFNDERIMTVGGQATRWFGITPRFQRENFRSHTLHGFGRDWPISYEDLEPYYCLAERHLGISGTVDNPFASPRSEPFPLPPFELSYTDKILAERLGSHGIRTHTTPQARVRQDYDGRPGCQNFGACGTCPIGARYSPNHHIEMIRGSGLFRLHTNCLVRRVIVEHGRGRGVAYHPDHGPRQIEHRADAVILAAGAVESARLLLLSKAGGTHRDGIGNASGQVGRNFGTHHVWWGDLTFADPIWPGRAGPPTLLTHQFALPKERGRHGGSTIELFDGFPGGLIDRVQSNPYLNGKAALDALRPALNKRTVTVNAEMVPGPGKYVTLSGERDRFGDPFAALNYKFDDFDHETHARHEAIVKRIMRATGAIDYRLSPIGSFWTAHHHLGTCRMGTGPGDSVVDSFGAIHETPGVYVCGGSTFVTVTPMQPTLSMVALAIRSAARISEDLAG